MLAGIHIALWTLVNLDKQTHHELLNEHGYWVELFTLTTLQPEFLHLVPGWTV